MYVQGADVTNPTRPASAGTTSLVSHLLAPRRAELVLAKDEAGERHRRLREHPEERRLDRLDTLLRSGPTVMSVWTWPGVQETTSMFCSRIFEGERLREHVERGLRRGVGDAPRLRT